METQEKQNIKRLITEAQIAVDNLHMALYHSELNLSVQDVREILITTEKQIEAHYQEKEAKEI